MYYNAIEGVFLNNFIILFSGRLGTVFDLKILYLNPNTITISVSNNENTFFELSGIEPVAPIRLASRFSGLMLK